MDTANYLRNRLPIIDKVIIPEKAWTGTWQNLEHIRIFGSKISKHISFKKRSKLDIHKT